MELAETHERIRYLRKSHLHLSQEEFGKLLGVSRSVIANIELNVLARPEQKEPLYKLICLKFGVNEEWLLTGCEPMFIASTREEEIATFIGKTLKSSSKEKPIKKEFISMLAQLSEDDWQTLEKMAIIMAENCKDRSKKENQE